jgi:hypothetical protein
VQCGFPGRDVDDKMIIPQAVKPHSEGPMSPPCQVCCSHDRQYLARTALENFNEALTALKDHHELGVPSDAMQWQCGENTLIHAHRQYGTTIGARHLSIATSAAWCIVQQLVCCPANIPMYNLCVLLFHSGMLSGSRWYDRAGKIWDRHAVGARATPMDGPFTLRECSKAQ